MSAPVCHVPPENVNVPQPGVRNLPAVPIAQPNLESLVNAVNALRQVVNILSGQQSVDGANGFSNSFSTTKPKTDGTWIEEKRVTQTVKVYNPDDRTQYIEVERINGLVMRNKDTKQTWVWKR